MNPSDFFWLPNRRLTHPRVIFNRALDRAVLEMPTRWPLGEVLAFIEANRSQIEASERSVEERQRRRLKTGSSPAQDKSLPPEIFLPAISETWTLKLPPPPASHRAIRESNWFEACPDSFELRFHGSGWTESRRFAAIKHWLQHRATPTLVATTRTLARDHGFSPAKIQIRSQRSRWGSCSAQGNISLNMTLMLLEPRLVEYVILHELCHLKHHNHSEDFWNLLTERMPDAMARRKELRVAEKALPPWLSLLQKVSI